MRVSASSPSRLAPPKSVSLAAARVLAGPARDQHVLGLDVAVDDPARVRVRERGGERQADLERRSRSDARPRRSAARASRPRPARRSGSRRPPRRRPHTARRSPGARSRAAARASRVARSRSPPGPSGIALDRDLAVQQLVVRAPDDAEAARAEALEQAVAPEHEARRRSAGAGASARRGAHDPRVRAGSAARRAALRVCADSTGCRVRHRSLASLPASAGNALDRELAGSPGRCPAVILGPFRRSPCKGAVGFVVL